MAKNCQTIHVWHMMQTWTFVFLIQILQTGKRNFNFKIGSHLNSNLPNQILKFVPQMLAYYTISIVVFLITVAYDRVPACLAALIAYSWKAVNI